MSLALHKENYFLHKLHSLTGIVPVGFYMVQHLTLNSFSLAGPKQFDRVIGFFELAEAHPVGRGDSPNLVAPCCSAVYGLFIHNRSEQNYVGTRYRWSQNRMYTLQRWTGILIFFFLVYHIATTTGAKYIQGSADVISYAAWRTKLTSLYGLWLAVYMIGVAASSYHLAYGIWNFCIRWGISISDQAQNRLQRFSFSFNLLSAALCGWGALAGFLIPGKPGVIEDPEAHERVRPTGWARG